MKKGIIFFGIIFLIVIAFYVYKHSNVEYASVIELEAAKDIPCDNVVYFYQSDMNWYNDSLGESNYEMDDSGCLTTAITSALSMQNIDVENVDVITPKTINKLLSDNNGYDSEGNMQWDKLEELIGRKVVRKQAGEVDSSKIDKLLKKGIYPIVRIRVGGNGPIHYVLITESHDGEYWCMDPMNKDLTPVPLSKHNNTIYAVRYIK